MNVSAVTWWMSGYQCMHVFDDGMCLRLLLIS